MASRNTIMMATATSRNEEESGQCPKQTCGCVLTVTMCDQGSQS